MNTGKCEYRFCRKKFPLNYHGNKKYCDRKCYEKELEIRKKEKRARERNRHYKKAVSEFKKFLRKWKDNCVIYDNRFILDTDTMIDSMIEVFPESEQISYSLIWDCLRELGYSLKNSWRKPYKNILINDYPKLWQHLCDKQRKKN
jgi:hypothetical protein